MTKRFLGWLPFLASAWFVIFLWWAWCQPNSLVSLLILGALVPAAAISFLGWWLHITAPASYRASPGPGSWWLATASLLLSLSVFFIFLDRPIDHYLLISAGAVLLYLGFFYALLAARHPTLNHRRLLRKISLNFLALAIFFSAASLFAWSVFISNIFWPLLPVVFLVMAILVAASLPSPKNKAGPERLFALLIALLSAQFFWVLNLWPVGFLIKGAVLSLLLYFMIYLARGWLAETFNRRAAWRVFGLCLATAVIILLMARWV